MSVQVNTYVMFGVVLPYADLKTLHGDDDAYDKCEPYCDNAFEADSINAKGDVTILFDGMDGKYVAVGHVTHRTDNHRHFDGPIKINAEAQELAFWMDAVQAALADIGISDPYEYGPPRWHVVAHYR